MNREYKALNSQDCSKICKLNQKPTNEISRTRQTQIGKNETDSAERLKEQTLSQKPKLYIKSKRTQSIKTKANE